MPAASSTTPRLSDAGAMSKTYTLRSYQRKPNGQDLLISSRDFPDLKVGDVVEISHPDDDAKRVLLKVNDLGGPIDNPKDSVTIDDDIIRKFNFKAFTNVHVRKVPHSDVAVDLVVLTCKDIYLGRSDMWQIKTNMEGNCVYLTKKIAFVDQNQQITVSEIWARGEKWNCGLVTDNTKICFRSTTACMSIFIQMSSEMWEYDSFGDLYFEKAVGFLRELFNKWKKEECLHDVTIVLFSRTFYDAKSIDDFPLGRREAIQMDYMGRLYEDYYRILVQNERYDEWTPSLVKLKKVFIEYQRTVLGCDGVVGHRHSSEHRSGSISSRPSASSGCALPAAHNSSAAQGNFLEVMNMSLNVYERYYVDRNFDRLGKVCMIITPGPGVFEVDRKLMLITKQRTIDSGCAADLICMGEQPLHAVPLFKFHKSPKETRADDYCIPHWINHSFYTSQSQLRVTATSQFIPRIKIASKRDHHHDDHYNSNAVMSGCALVSAARQPSSLSVPRPRCESSPSSPGDEWHSWLSGRTDVSGSELPSSEAEYDAYDAAVFKVPKVSRHRSVTSSACLGGGAGGPGGAKKLLGVPQTAAEAMQFKVPRRRGTSDNYTVTMADREAAAAAAVASRAVRSSGGLVNRSLCAIPADLNGLPDRALDVSTSKNSIDSDESEDQFVERMPAGSPDVTDGRLLRGLIPASSNKALINPFAPSYIRFRMTSNRRRWAHAFPLDKQGQTIQPHHQYNEVSAALSLSSKLMLTSGAHKVQMFRRVSTEPHLKRQDSVSSVIMAGEAGPPSSHQRNRTISNDSLEESVYVSPHSAAVVGSQEGTSMVTPDNSALWDAGWGVAGDTEWSPMITTGVDWRSLTRPALLPVTTDYLPDKQSFLKDYIVASSYILEADSSSFDVGVTDGSALAAGYFKELINTRMALGFQLILLPPKSEETADKSLERTPTTQPASHLTYLSRTRPRTRKETYCLSIGRIFHELTKTDNVITVTVQRPKESSKLEAVTYKYRFMCPDEDRYIVSRTKYGTEQPEEYNWNYLDNYIITRGDNYVSAGDGQEQGLIETMKYWRARFLLLPANLSGLPAQSNAAKTKPSVPLDLFIERQLGDFSKACDDFLKLLEFVNKFKRSVTASASSSSSKAKFEKAGSLDNALASDSQVGADHGGARHKSGHDSSSAPNLVESLDVSSIDCVKVADSLVHADSLQFLKHDRLPPNTFVAAEACAWALKNVPAVKSVRHAVQLMQFMAKQGFIKHVSGNREVRFEYGMNLFYVPGGPSLGVSSSSSPGAAAAAVARDDTDTKKTWIEVTVARDDELSESVLAGSASFMDDAAAAIAAPSTAAAPPGSLAVHQRAWVGSTHSLVLHPPGTPVSSAPSSLKRESFMASAAARKSQYASGSGGGGSSLSSHAYVKYKSATVEIDSGEKSGRMEWVSVRHDAHYHPRCAFDLEVDWIVATGLLVSEVIKAWAKKATSLGFQLLPAPIDPFALPHNEYSDPLRGPIFVPINLGILKAVTTGSTTTHSVHDSSCVKHLKQAIVKRYGFMPVSWDPERGGSCGSSGRGFYVHCSGGMYVNLEAACVGHGQRLMTPPSHGGGSSSNSGSSGIEPLPAGITPEDPAVGFTWSWNFMLSKRWRSAQTGDEAFQDAMLADFRAFCSGNDERLLLTWHGIASGCPAVAAASGSRTGAAAAAASAAVAVVAIADAAASQPEIDGGTSINGSGSIAPTQIST